MLTQNIMNATEKTARIQAAITVHFEWFNRLKAVVAHGSSAFKPEIVRTDNNCDFGKWVHSDMRTVCPNDQVFNEIRQVHAEFHKLAADILTMALRGDKEAATKEIEIGGKLASLSGRLTIILRRL